MLTIDRTLLTAEIYKKLLFYLKPTYLKEIRKYIQKCLCFRFTGTTRPGSYRDQLTKDEEVTQPSWMSADISRFLTPASSHFPSSLHENSPSLRLGKMVLWDRSLPSPRCAGFLSQVAFLAPSTFPLDFLACRVVSGSSQSVPCTFLTSLCFLASGDSVVRRS